MNICVVKKYFFTLGVITLCVFFEVACTKNSTDDTPPVVPPVIPPVTPPDSLTINFAPFYPNPGDYYDSQYELIVSTTSGKIILDTLTPMNASLPISFKTIEKLVDVTTIASVSPGPQYTIKTYKGVNPSQWDSLFFGFGYNADPVLLPTPIGKMNLHYYNIPAAYNQVYLFNAGYGPTASSITTTKIDVQYDKRPETPTYIVFPTLGMYKLYDQIKPFDTLNLSTMDTTVKRKFNLPASFEITDIDLFGFPDTTNHLKVINLYNDVIRYRYTESDIQYPSKSQFQKYQLTLKTKNADNDYTYHFSYGDTAAYTINFIGEADYTLNATQKDNFSVTFKNNNITYYSSKWTSGPATWYLYSSPDSSSINPLNFFNNIKTKSHFLNGLDFSDLKISNFSAESIEKVNYPTYLAYTFNSKLHNKRLIYSANRFTKVL